MLHRDIKPPNPILDALGNIWITDFRPGAIPELTIPSSDSAYYLSINGLVSNVPAHLQGGTAAARITAEVHAAGDGTRLMTVRDLDEIDVANRNETFIQDDFTIDKRFHFIPAANLLLPIPFGNDRVVLRRLEIAKAMKRLGGEYLVVTTPSSLFATAGKTLDHEIHAFSNASGLQYAVAQGPEGLTVSPNGKLRWLPPKSAADGEVVRVVISVADSAGAERFHTLKIQVD